MIELIVLDENFSPVGVVDGFLSLIWRRKYYDVGDYELHTDKTAIPVLTAGKYIYCKDKEETGVIQRVSFSQNSGASTVVARGEFLESILKARAVIGTHNLTGTGEEVIRALIMSQVINPSDNSRAISSLILGAECGVGQTITTQITRGGLFDRIKNICLSQEIAVRVRLDLTANKMICTVWQGKDRTDTQTVNAWAIFSEHYENVIANEYERDISDYKNVAYVAGAGEGAARVVEEVDLSSGGARYELDIDARDIARDVGGVEMDIDDYRALLRQRGIEKLAQYTQTESVRADINTTANLVYKQDFDLGDVCLFVNGERGISASGRITAITEVHESGAYTVSATLGEDDLTIMKKIRREVL